MQNEKKEVEHTTQVLQEIKTALTSRDALKLKDLSNKTVHSASSHQDSASITIAVIRNGHGLNGKLISKHSDNNYNIYAL